MVRVVSGVLLALGILALILYGTPFHFFVFTTIVAGLASYEFFGMLKSGNKPSTLVIGVPMAALFEMALYYKSGVYAMDAALILFMAGSAYTVFCGHKDRLAAGANLVYGVVYTAIPMAALALIRSAPDGAAYTVMLIAATALCDTGAFYFGKTFGKRKLAPSLSPGKTVEGFFGGVAGAIAGALIIWQIFLPSQSALTPLACGLLAGFLGPVGDLAESAIKREMGVKDSGALIPGHGGVLDRVDSLLFTSAAFYIFLRTI